MSEYGRQREQYRGNELDELRFELRTLREGCTKFDAALKWIAVTHPKLVDDALKAVGYDERAAVE